MIPFRRFAEYLPVDVAAMRPKDSYRKVVEGRNYPVERLIAEHGRIPDDFLTERPCPTCGGRGCDPELEKEGLALVRCRDCDLVFVNPVFDEAHYKTIYRAEKYQEIVRDLGEASHDYRVERFGKERVEIMTRFLRNEVSAAPRYLDIGCSTGFVVEAARDAGWQASGLDLNPSAVAFGRKRGLDLREGGLDDHDWPAESFDAVSLFDVLEHLVKPGEILAKALRLLKPGGIVFVYVPNYDSASRLLLGVNAVFIWPTHHLTYYTAETLGELLRRHGLDVEYTATEGLDLIDYIWWQREMEGRDVGALEAIADKLQFFVNAGAYGKNLRMIGRRS